MHFSKFPRLFFAHLPTPLEPMTALSKELGGANLWIKRDDCTGLAGGGNKTRKLEFLMADALKQKADVIITQGAIQSNHVRQTAAISAKLGMECRILLEDRISSDEKNYRSNGNVLFDRIFGASIDYFPGGTDMAEEMEKMADRLKTEKRRPYIIPGGGSNGIGALGYANAAFELVSQANDRNLKIDHIVHATGSTGTQGGLVAGLKSLNAGIPVLGISVRLPGDQQEKNVLQCALKTADLLGTSSLVSAADIKADGNYVGEGYGIPTKEAVAAINQVARLEGILLDPVYSAKGMAGLIDLVKKGYFQPGENIVFIHTGGAQALPGYDRYFS